MKRLPDPMESIRRVHAAMVEAAGTQAKDVRFICRDEWGHQAGILIFETVGIGTVQPGQTQQIQWVAPGMSGPGGHVATTAATAAGPTGSALARWAGSFQRFEVSGDELSRLGLAEQVRHR